MTSKKVHYLLLLFLLVAMPLGTHLSAQSLNHRQGQILVQLEAKQTIERVVQSFKTYQNRPTQLRVVKEVSQPLDIWLLEFDWTTIPELDFLDYVNRSERVNLAQLNHLVEMRSTIPDDPLFGQQFQHLNTGQGGGTPGADMDTDLAWDITTGGLTASGDTIVVAVLDNGVNLQHQDLGENLWINHAEIPDNNIDDDNNGFVDDFLGWNSQQDNDNVGAGGGHGTPVAGIIGAIGNNGVGVAGVNWQIKLMIIKNDFNTDEAAVLSAYSYALVQRKRYNETQGAEGAFVVATNASWGVDLGQPEDAPLWCNFYDTLGVYGILNCGATINGNVNVDEEGDLPTACPSDFMISVTNMNRTDNKVTQAGFGVETIDLGAFGAGAFATTVDGGYGGFGGTSGATPQVCGAIGLLYSAPCSDFSDMIMTDPANAALMVRQAILDGVDPNASLDTITVTGGRLNINNSLRLLLAQCGVCFPPSGLRESEVLDTSVVLSWNINDSISQVDLRYRVRGDTLWTMQDSVISPLSLTDLMGCTEYEYQLRSICSMDTSEYSTSRVFLTDGCCVLPETIEVEVLDSNSLDFTLSSVLAAESYLVRYRPTDGSADWAESIISSQGGSLVGLDPCTEYEVQLRTTCDGDSTNFSPSQILLTTGCGFCFDTEYCPPEDMTVGEEWIAFFGLGDVISNETNGNPEEGFALYSDPQGDVVSLERGLSYAVIVVPDWGGNQFDENLAIFLDGNRDGEFLSADDELLLFAGGISDTLRSYITIPTDAELGVNRLRVLMNFNEIDDSCPGPGQNFGEVEDYCVELVDGNSCPYPTALDTTVLGLDSILITWPGSENASNYDLRFRVLGEGLWTEINGVADSVTLSNLDSCAMYEVELRVNCGSTRNEFSLNTTFETACINSTIDPVANRNWQVFPNPTRDIVQMQWDGDQSELDDAQLSLTDISGRLLQSRPWTNARQQSLNLSDLAPGVYFLRLDRPGQTGLIRRIVKF